MLLLNGYITLQIGDKWKWVFGAGILTHIATIFRLFWWISRKYIQYKQDYIRLLNEHKTLVLDYNQRNPHKVIPKFMPYYEKHQKSRHRSSQEHE